MSEWWKDAVVYQIYPKSFADSDGDGVGDLNGISARIGHLEDLGVDAVWLSPFYPSPGADGGYDVADYMDIDPAYGGLDDFDAMLTALHSAGIRLIVDIVPNHCSSAHPLFRKALSALPGSPERELFHFRDGMGPEGTHPPNNWQSHFGGPAWTRAEDGQWYLHLFDSGQPDFNWDHPAVHSHFHEVLRFWLDRGVDGFRVDVAHLMKKDPRLPDWGGPANGAQDEDFPTQLSPMFGRPEVHEIFADWRRILDDYSKDKGRERMMCGEVCVDPLEWQAEWTRPGEMQTVFNFSLLTTPFTAEAWKQTIVRSLQAYGTHGAPTTWVLSNHDVARHATRLAYPDGYPKPGDGIGPNDLQPVDAAHGVERATAATSLLMALPGSIYLYQGEELGLPDHTTLSSEEREDPTFHRTDGARVGRDGCRIPLPWDNSQRGYGFSPTGQTWLSQPAEFSALAVNRQDSDPLSILSRYRDMISLRKRHSLGAGQLTLLSSPPEVLAFDNAGVRVIMNPSDRPVDISPLIGSRSVEFESRSGSLAGNSLSPRSTVWIR